MPGKHLLLETESGDSEAAEPQGEGELIWSLIPDSLKQFSVAGVKMKNRGILCYPYFCGGAKEETSRKKVIQEKQSTKANI